MKLAAALASLGLFAGVVFGKDQDAKLGKRNASDNKKRDLGYYGGHYGGHYLDEEFCDLTGMYEVLESLVHAESYGDITTDGVARISFVCYNEEELYTGYTDYGLHVPYPTFHTDTCYDRSASMVHMEEEKQEFAGTSEAMKDSVNPEHWRLIDFHLCTFEAIGFPDEQRDRRELQLLLDGSGVPNYGIVVTATIDFGYGPICVFVQVCAVALPPDSKCPFETYVAGVKVRDNLLQFGVWLDTHPFSFADSDDFICPFSAFKTSKFHSHIHY